eukprot:3547856-Pyramimonas_sp.AAC.1
MASELQDIERRKEGGSPPPPPPPPPVAAPVPVPSAVSFFSTSHLLDDSGRKCKRCMGSASLGRLEVWKGSSCFQPLNLNGDFYTVPDGHRLH